MSDISNERLDDGKADPTRQAIPGWDDILAFGVDHPKIAGME